MPHALLLFITSQLRGKTTLCVVDKGTFTNLNHTETCRYRHGHFKKHLDKAPQAKQRGAPEVRMGVQSDDQMLLMERKRIPAGVVLSPLLE